MFKNIQDKASEPTIQYDGTNFLEFSNNLKKNLAGNSDRAIVVPTLKTLKVDEWITLAKEQMAAIRMLANMLGISHVHDEADLGINFDIPTKTIPRDDDS